MSGRPVLGCRMAGLIRVLGFCVPISPVTVAQSAYALPPPVPRFRPSGVCLRRRERAIPLESYYGKTLTVLELALYPSRTRKAAVFHHHCLILYLMEL